ncbi:MAG: hypothetical protein MJ223_02675 [Mycoplasmoidaceae bacterium]|nr:hypothetical protein [Mycoplasmoidaceae bacterium]
MLDIVYCCNDKVFDGLYLSILSILRRTSQNINFYVITGNLLEIKDTYLALSDFHKQLLEK